MRRFALALVALLLLVAPVQAQRLTGGCAAGSILFGCTLSGDTTLPGSGQISGAGWIGAGGVPVGLLSARGNVSSAFWGNGLYLSVAPLTATDTTSSGAVASIAVSNVGFATLAASSPTTYGRAATFRVGSVSTAGSNVTITDNNSLEVAGPSYFIGNVRSGAITGGTNNGNMLLSNNDRFPSFLYRTATTTAAQIVSDVTVGSFILDAPGGLQVRDTINGGNTRFSIATTTGIANFGAGFVQWAGATSAFPALKRSSTALQARLADDSNFAPFAASGYSAGAVAGVSCGAGTVNPVTTVVTSGIITTC